MSSGKSLAPNIQCALLPGSRNVVEAVHRSSASPQSEQGARYFFVEVGLVVLKINACRRTVILAHGVQCAGVLETAQVLCIAVLADRFWDHSPKCPCSEEE